VLYFLCRRGCFERDVSFGRGHGESSFGESA
jgi:succinate dehydrogenase flavin-adding protein (antitoxin of CptAB toxin-antitoxin module)